MYYYSINSLFVTIFIVNHLTSVLADVIRPRGVSLAKKIFYYPSKDFACIDGSQTIPFKNVNDDYCDCADGSDEPGTSACPNGSFHCTNVGYFEKDIYSSMVNDGICDCCDGSDEWSSNANCHNNCMELGEASREEYRKQQEILRQGNEIREGYVKEANEKKMNVDIQIKQLKQELTDLEAEKSEKHLAKEASDQDEREALEKHNAKLDELKKLFEETEAKKAKEEEDKLAMSAFKELDVNEDGSIHYTEIMKFGIFDHDTDGIVSEQEAKEVLNNQETIALEEFLRVGWTLIRPYYLTDKTATNTNEQQQDAQHETEHHDDSNQESNPEQISPIETGEDIETIDENNQEDYHDEDSHDNTREDYYTKSADNGQAPELDYDEETKQLMEKAKADRDSYSNVEQRFMSVQNKIQELENSQKYDYGPEDEFLPLHGQCFEFTDREYTYKLCSFDMASQRPKDGVGETNLGRWGHWSGTPDTKKYSSFKLENGSICWNGPPRSVVVLLSCGLENKLVAASEPTRCEYQFEFETPARCVLKTSSGSSSHAHTEL